MESGRGGLAAKQIPPRPGHAPALGLRAESGGIFIVSQAGFAALREAKQWLRTVPAGEALARLGVRTEGVVRGQRPVRQEMRGLPKPKEAAGDYKPYAHPRYWSAFILLGDPD